MTLCDAVNDFRGKITLNSRDTRYCTFAPPEETVGVIDLSADGDGSRGIAFLIDRMMIRLGADARQMYYRDIRVTEILPSYETPFEDELVIASPAGSIRISDCGLNKFFLRQLINTLCRMSNTMKEQDREAMESRLTAEALSYYSGGGSLEDAPPVEESESEKPESIPPVTVAAVAAVQEIAAAKKAAMSEIPASPITITEEKIQWLSGKQPSVPAEPEEMDSEPESLEDMTRDEAMNYLLDSIAEINSTSGEPSAIPEPESPDPDIPESSPVAESAQQKPGIPPQQEAAPKLTHEPDSQDIYIKASRRIRELCEEGRLTMEQVDSAVREQLVQASEVYSTLDVGSAQLPPAVKEHAMNLAAAADHLTDYFALGEDIAARVMFFMLYQMLSYTDRIVQSDETKQRLNYFFVRFGAAGIILSMLDANN
ncbi:MAG: hypothetical protein EGR45_02110 [Ruminococcaceae bacterium]|nr:hypothetical protein [Oscillospiraceae bacterium]